MKLATRAAALLASAALCTTALAGCSNGGAPGASQYKTEDIISQLTDGAVTRDTEFLTVDGQPVTAEELLYWAIYDCDYLAAYYYGGAENMTWDQTFSGDQTLDQYILSDAQSTAKLYRLLETHAAEDGVALTEEDKATLQSERVDGQVEELGGEQEFKDWLSQIGLSFDAYYKLNSVQYLYQNYLSTISDEEIDQFIEDNEYYRVKHILISTQDDEGNALSDEEKAAAKQKAEDLLAQLRASDDPLTLFDELMKENSEDPGLSSYPDGYIAAPGDMVEPFEKASLALEENEISDVVESENGYHIILRLDADTADTRGSYFDTVLDGWMNDAIVVESEAYQTFDLESFYNNLTDYRLSLQEAEEPTETETGSPAPTDTASAQPEDSTAPEETGSASPDPTETPAS